MGIRQIFLSHAIFLLSKSEVSVVFNISSSYANTNLPNRRFSQQQFLICQYPSILHVLLQKQSHVTGLHIFTYTFIQSLFTLTRFILN